MQCCPAGNVNYLADFCWLSPEPVVFIERLLSPLQFNAIGGNSGLTVSLTVSYLSEAEQPEDVVGKTRGVFFFFP